MLVVHEPSQFQDVLDRFDALSHETTLSSIVTEYMSEHTTKKNYNTKL